MKASPRINSFFLILLFFSSSLPILNAQDKISDSELDRMRKAAQERLANKQGLNYEIVDVQMKEGQFLVKYDLNEPVGAEYIVAMVFLREEDPLFKIIPKAASGAIGKGKFAGKDNTITWNYKHDYPMDLKGDDFYFVLDIMRIDQSSTPWVWIGLGGVAAGGATYLLLMGQGNTTPVAVEIPRLNIIRPN